MIAALPEFSFTAPPPLGLYVHVPWCVRKCPYCDFNSHAVGESALPEAAYLDALVEDLEAELPRIWGRTVRTVFIGGGTPSLLSPVTVDKLLAAVRARLTLAPDAEITLEANPGTVERGRFAELRAAGINRLSIGVQSFDDRLLAAIGRIHTGEEAVCAAESAHDAGFGNVNLDLMFGLPGQSEAAAAADLARALELAPTHLSRYQLTIEPDTAFARRPPPEPDDETLWSMQETGTSQLLAAGFDAYEVSAFARPGFQCRHNLNYWRFGDYLGIGAGAHGKVTDAPGGRILRNWKASRPGDYLDRSQRIAGEQALSDSDVAFEFMLNALRLVEGFETELFTARTGLPLAVIEPSLKQAEAGGLLAVGEAIRPTPHGRRFLNDLIAIFLPEG